jgi:hypothetical protein
MMDVAYDETLAFTPVQRKRKGRPDVAPKLDEAIESHLPKTPVARMTKDLRTIQDGLQQAFTLAGVGVSMFNLYDAMVIHQNAELLAKHWTKVAEQNAAVRKYLLAALQGGTWAGAVMTTLAVLVVIAANHTEIPDEVADMVTAVGVSVPDKELREMPSMMSQNGDGSTT